MRACCYMISDIKGGLILTSQIDILRLQLFAKVVKVIQVPGCC